MALQVGKQADWFQYNNYQHPQVKGPSVMRPLKKKIYPTHGDVNGARQH